MIDKENWKKEYAEGKTLECPCCGQDSPEHSCRECHSDIDKQICWANDGFCQRCFDFIHKEIPRIEELKNNLGVKCKCDTALCGKCLGSNCKDNNCPVHTEKLKADWQRRNKR